MQKPKQLVYQYICWNISLVGGTFAAVGTRFKKSPNDGDDGGYYDTKCDSSELQLDIRYPGCLIMLRDVFIAFSLALVVTH